MNKNVPLFNLKEQHDSLKNEINQAALDALNSMKWLLGPKTQEFEQNFAKAFDVKFLNKENKLDYVWATSWGVSTRLIGALVMSHSDDNGLVLPPKIAPLQVVIVPIYRDKEGLEKVSKVAVELKTRLEQLNISVKYDDRDSLRSGEKFNIYELKGVPVRITIGPRDLEQNQVEICRRDTLEKSNMHIQDVAEAMPRLLEDIQESIFQKAKKFRDDHIIKADTWEEFEKAIENGGFVSAHWDGTTETEVAIKEKTKATIRCIPFNNPQEEGKCILTGKPSKERVLFAKAY